MAEMPGQGRQEVSSTNSKRTHACCAERKAIDIASAAIRARVACATERDARFTAHGRSVELGDAAALAAFVRQSALDAFAFALRLGRSTTLHS